MRLTKTALLWAMLLASVAVMRAQTTDVTDLFIENASFDNDSNQGWTWTTNASCNMGYGAMEFWNGTFNVWQDLTGLPEGDYVLSVQAYYRMGDNAPSYQAHHDGTETLTALLYAGTATTPLVSVYSESFSSNLSSNCWQAQPREYYPNGMASASQAFSRDAYWNHLDFSVDGSGAVRIGLVNETYNPSNWCCFDNFRLSYKGAVVKAQSVSVSADHTSLLPGETVQCVATVSPANALDKRLSWSSSNAAVASVDANGLVTAKASGTARITAMTMDGTNRSGAVTLTVSRSPATKESVVINEIMASNVDQFVSPAYNFDGWVELYNPTATAVELGQLYLSDDAANLTQWQLPLSAGVLPAHGYRTLWFDSHDIAPQNAPFKLDVDGGMLYLSSPSGQLLASQAYPAGVERASYARTTDGGSTWQLTSTPTPGATNNQATFAAQQLAAPVADQPSQLFTTPLSVNVVIPAGQTLRYTTDGTLPTLQNGHTSTTGQFGVTETTVFRFRLFGSGMLPSNVTTRSYIYREFEPTLPVVSVVSDPRFLYDDSLGVYVQGVNGRPGNGQPQACNWNMNWERPVNFSYLDASGAMVLNQDVNLEMCGGWSRAWSPHSFKLKGNKELGGEKNLLYPFFADKPYIRNRTLQIRNGGNDTQARFKDPALQHIVQTSGVDIDVQSYQPVHEFINGQYVGVLNVREPNNKHYVYANYGWGDDEIDQFEMSPDSGYVQKCGTPDAYNELCDVLSADAANPETYAEIGQLLDLDEYANYMAAEFYLGGTDWPQNNVKGFRHQDGGRFRFVLFDLDGTFATNDPFNTFMWKETYTFDQLYPTSLGRKTDHIRYVTLFRNLLQNADFRRKFIDAYCLMGGSVFEAERAVSIIGELQARVEPAMAMEWYGSYYLKTTANDLRNRLSARLETATTALRNFGSFGLQATTPQRVVLGSNVSGAQLLVNGQQVPTGSFNGYLFRPVTLSAQPLAGYEFQGWQSSGSVGTTLKAAGSQWSYYDQGSLDNQNWTSPTYGEGGWKQGNAPLGYGNPNVQATTTLSYGNNSSNKRPTYYFRTAVTLSDVPQAGDQFLLDYVADDGFIVYVNGSEAARYNMPQGSVGYSTFATTYAYDNPARGTVELPAQLFLRGRNVIAVELHNNSPESTDILWDASLHAVLAGSSQDYYATEPQISLPEGNSVQLTASYRKLSSAELAQKGCPKVRINEVSGQNDSYINDYGKKDDWLELYNTTDEEVDVEGMYLTDNLEKPTKYQITKGTTRAQTKIAARGHLLVWCGKRQTTNGGLHASFKIDGDGGALQLMAADKSWSDTFYYGAHTAAQTVGRYPDGADDIYEMNMATIAQPNRLSSYMVATDQEQLKADYELQTGMGRPTLASRANGFRLCYGSGLLLLKGDDDVTAEVELFAADGRLAGRHTAVLSHGTARIDVSDLPRGFYVARATIDRHTRVACKFMR